MKNKKSFHLVIALLALMVSFACSLFTRAEATPTSDPYIFPEVTTPLKIEPESLSNAQAWVTYEVELRISDNVTPLNSVFLSNGTLPAGLELAFVEGEDSAMISGTPEEAGTFTFTVFVSCVGTMVQGRLWKKNIRSL